MRTVLCQNEVGTPPAWMTAAEMLADLPPALRVDASSTCADIERLRALPDASPRLLQMTESNAAFARDAGRLDMVFTYRGLQLRVRRCLGGATWHCGYVDDAPYVRDGVLDAIHPHGGFTDGIGFDCKHLYAGDRDAVYGDEPMYQDAAPAMKELFERSCTSGAGTHKTWRFAASEARRVADAILAAGAPPELASTAGA
jgi:hypothetical protein